MADKECGKVMELLARASEGSGSAPLARARAQASPCKASAGKATEVAEEMKKAKHALDALQKAKEALSDPKAKLTDLFGDLEDKLMYAKIKETWCVTCFCYHLYFCFSAVLSHMSLAHCAQQQVLRCVIARTTQSRICFAFLRNTF